MSVAHSTLLCPTLVCSGTMRCQSASRGDTTKRAYYTHTRVSNRQVDLTDRRRRNACSRVDARASTKPQMTPTKDERKVGEIEEQEGLGGVKDRNKDYVNSANTVVWQEPVIYSM